MNRDESRDGKTVDFAGNGRSVPGEVESLLVTQQTGAALLGDFVLKAFSSQPIAKRSETAILNPQRFALPGDELPSMRIRVPFAGAFCGLCLTSTYLGFSHHRLPVNDKLQHSVAFFLLTFCFYWILETTRRRVFNMTLVTCTILGGVGSEFAQSLLPYRQFDPFDILANLLGSGFALLLCTWYHKRMLERKRSAKKYQPIAGDEDAVVEDNVEAGEELQDLEARVDRPLGDGLEGVKK